MLTLIHGRLGSGKTYEAVRYHIVPTLLDGRKVITNIPVKLEEINKAHEVAPELLKIVDYDFHDYGAKRPFSSPDDYIDEWRNDKGQSPLVVVDEAHLSLPKGRATAPMFEFITMSRHKGVDIVFVSQHPQQIYKDILALIDVCHYCVKNRAFGDETSYTKKVKDGYRGPELEVTTRHYSPLYFSFYKSHTGSDKPITEASAKDVKSVYDNFAHRYAKYFIIIGLIPTLYYGYGLFSSPESPAHTITRDGKTATLNFDQPKPQKTIKSQFTSFPPQDVKTSQELPSNSSFELTNLHPYHKVNLHVGGNLTSKGVEKWLFIASENGQKSFYLSDQDLESAGYKLTYMNSCMVKISYSNFYEEYLTCDKANVSTFDAVL